MRADSSRKVAATRLPRHPRKHDAIFIVNDDGDDVLIFFRIFRSKKPKQPAGKRNKKKIDRLQMKQRSECQSIDPFRMGAVKLILS